MNFRDVNLIEIYRAKDEFEANIIKGLLESNGIKCIFSSDATHSVHAFTINGLGEVRILVREEDVEIGRELILSRGHLPPNNEILVPTENLWHCQSPIGYGVSFPLSCYKGTTKVL